MYNKAMRKIALLFIVIISALIFTSINVYSDSSLDKNKNVLEVHFIDVGQGDCTLIILPDGKNILIDAGNLSEGPKVIKYLRSLNIKQIDHLIITHPHDDHFGGIFSIASEFEINNFYDNGFSNFNSTLYVDYLKIVRRNLSKYNVLQAGESLFPDSIKIIVLNPLLPPTGDLNEDSIVIRLVFGKMNILLAGDLGNLGERRLIKTGTELRSRILKVGHHASQNSSSHDFLEKVKPEAAIVSVNSINKYGYPDKETLDRLSNSGAIVYRTDQSGNIVLKTDGNTYSIHTEKSLLKKAGKPHEHEIRIK